MKSDWRRAVFSGERCQQGLALIRRFRAGQLPQDKSIMFSAPIPVFSCLILVSSVGSQIYKGTWCSGITSASHAEGPGFKSQCVHIFVASRSIHVPPATSHQALCLPSVTANRRIWTKSDWQRVVFLGERCQRGLDVVRRFRAGQLPQDKNAVLFLCELHSFPVKL